MRGRTLLIALIAGLASACGAAIDRRAVGDAPVEVAVLDESAVALKAAFNAASDDVRLLFIVGPSCGPCLRGLIDMNENLGADLLSNPRLRVFVVHVPTLGAQERHAQRAAQLLRGASVMHYWDPSGRSGELLQKTLKIPEYAWDVWLTYAPGATWDGEAPPPPVSWAHQLGRLPAKTRLDPKAFTADVRQRVERLR